jgi:hypothetical protein
VADPVEQIMIPEGATEISLWVNPLGFYQLLFLWIVLEDQTGRSQIVTLGELGTPGWNELTAEIPEFLVGPLRVVAIQINEPGFGATGTVGQAVFDDLQAVIGSTGEKVLLEGFEGQIDWVPLVTSAIGGDELSVVSDVIHTGDRAVVFSFGKEMNRSIRGIRNTGGNGLIPAIASSSFAETVGASRGSTMVVGVSGGLVPIEIVDIVDYFPTLDPVGGGFLIFGLTSLLSYVNALSPLSGTEVNEFFISTTEGFELSVFAEVSALVRNRGEVSGTSAQIVALSQDPLVTAGWRAMVIVAMMVIVFTAGLGYIVYLLAFTDRSMGEMGVLRSLGLSKMQTAGLIGLEHMLVALIGLGVGTWAGFQMSRMVVSAVTVTDSGGRVVPPFILQTDWTIMGSIYGLLLLIFLGTLYILGRRMLHLDLQRLSRLGG